MLEVRDCLPVRPVDLAVRRLTATLRPGPPLFTSHLHRSLPAGAGALLAVACAERGSGYALAVVRELVQWILMAPMSQLSRAADSGARTVIPLPKNGSIFLVGIAASARPTQHPAAGICAGHSTSMDFPAPTVSSRNDVELQAYAATVCGMCSMLGGRWYITPRPLC